MKSMLHVIAGMLVASAIAANVDAQPRQPAPRKPVAAKPAPVLPKGFVSVNGGYQITTNDFDDGETLRINAEDAPYEADYTVKGGPAFDVAGGARVWRNLAAGVAISRFSRATPAFLDGSVPHPFFFSRPRPVSGEITNLKREELAVHLQARAIVPLGRRLQLMAFGGPTLFQITQGIITDYTYSESYPYDTAAFSSAQTTIAKESKVGFNAGADVAFFFTRQLGVGFSAQIASAEIDIPSAAGNTMTVKAGGASAGVGLRVRF